MPPQSFNRLVLDGFDLAKVSKRATVLSISAVAFTLISVRVPEVQWYLWLFWAFVLIAFLSGKSDTLFGHPAWRIRNIWKPIGLGVASSLCMYSLILLATSWTPKGSAGDLFPKVVAWGLMVGTVEEFGFRWVLLGTLPYAVFTSNLLFAAMHPAVMDSMTTGDPAGLGFFFAYFFFGLFLTGIVMAYEKSKWFEGTRWAGPLLAITLHASHNVFIVIWGPTIGGMQISPY